MIHFATNIGFTWFAAAGLLLFVFSWHVVRWLGGKVLVLIKTVARCLLSTSDSWW